MRDWHKLKDRSISALWVAVVIGIEVQFVRFGQPPHKKKNRSNFTNRHNSTTKLESVEWC